MEWKNEAITYKDLFLSFIQTTYIRTLDIRQRSGEHASLYLEAVLHSEIEENDLHGIGETMTLLYVQEGEIKPLFYGVIDEISTKKDGDSRILFLEAWDATRIMDTEKRFRAFQNPAMKVKELVDEVMKTYPGCDYKLHIPNVSIGQLLMQYGETDWEFLKRIFSKYYAPVYPDPAFDAVRLQMGESKMTEDWNWDAYPFELFQNFEELNARKENGFAELSCAQTVQYQVESYDIASLGSQVCYKGNSWYIKEVKRTLKDGLLVSQYRLSQKEAMKILPYFNEKLTGVSVDGQIVAVARDKVQVEMELDAGSGEPYWFPFSTVASSSDGSGWYCMPEIGESVRVYFPVDDEKEAYVVTNIKAHEPQQGTVSAPMDNPKVRTIETAQGNQVQFTEEGVLLATGSGEGKILLKKTGEILLDAKKDIVISAGEAINIVASNELVMKSQTSIKIANETGAEVELKKGRIRLHGMTIHEN